MLHYEQFNLSLSILEYTKQLSIHVKDTIPFAVSVYNKPAIFHITSNLVNVN